MAKAKTMSSDAGRGRREEGRRLRRAARTLGVVAAGAAASAAWGAKEENPAGALAAVAIFLALTPIVQFAVAALLPAFTRRANRAVCTGFWPSAGWGALFTVLVVTVAAILAQGGQAGQVVAGVAGGGAAALALAGGVGIAKCLGDWSLGRWGLGEMGPLSVATGALLWALGAMVPVVGWAGALLCLFASLGAGVQVLLHPGAFDEVGAWGEDLGPEEDGVRGGRDLVEDETVDAGSGEDDDEAGPGTVGAR